MITSIMTILTDEITTSLTTTLADAFEKNRSEKPRQIEHILKDIIETDLKQHLNDLSDLGLQTLETGYDRITVLLNTKINDLKKFLKKVIDELFGIDYHYEQTVYNLSDRDDFYVRVNDNSGAFLVDHNNFIFLMPRNYANTKIYHRVVEKMKNDVKLNINNMIYNYQYKIQESVRSFKGILTSESATLKKEVVGLINQVMIDKENTSNELCDKKVLQNSPNFPNTKNIRFIGFI